MRKFLISAALLASTARRCSPRCRAVGAAGPQGYGYGYNNYGQVRRLEARVDQIRRQIRQLDRRNILSDREARRLGDEARYLDQRINVLARNGFNGRDRYDVERRLARLEQRIAPRGQRRQPPRLITATHSFDRDRDGRDDRYEDDRGRDHDGAAIATTTIKPLGCSTPVRRKEGAAPATGSPFSLARHLTVRRGRRYSAGRRPRGVAFCLFTRPTGALHGHHAAHARLSALRRAAGEGRGGLSLRREWREISRFRERHRGQSARPRPPASDQGDPGAGRDADARLQPLRHRRRARSSPSGWST